MDRERLTSFIKDDEVRIKMYRVIDLISLVKKNYEIRFTEFLNPFEMRCAISILNSQRDLEYKRIGGYTGAERSILAVYPDYYFFDEKEESPISVVEITGALESTHREYLGAVLGIGLRREKIGDILVHENLCQMIVRKDISDFIVFNLEKVGKNKVRVKEIPLGDISPVEHEFDSLRITVSSPRLDSVVSEVYNLSRSSAVKIINSSSARVDYEVIENPSYFLKEGSLVSVRHYGRFLVDEFGGKTRKGKLVLNIKKYV